MGSNHRPPDYEFPIELSTGLHRVVSVCTSLSYFTLYVKDYTGLHAFVEILAPKLALEFQIILTVQILSPKISLTIDSEYYPWWKSGGIFHLTIMAGILLPS